MTRVVWTDGLRAELAPRAASSSIDAGKTWKRIRNAVDSSWDGYKKGLGQEGAAREETEVALAVLAMPDWPKDPSPAALGAGLAIAQYLGRGDLFIALVGQTCGAAAAMRAVLDALAFRTEMKHPKLWLVRDAMRWPTGWRALRLVTLTHGEADAVRVAREAWPRASLNAKIIASHALPSAPHLAADVAREVAALPADQRLIVAPVLASLRDASLLDGVLAHRSGAHPLVDAVENLGEAALPAFLAQWERPIFDRAHLARATSCFEDERVARIFAGELTKKTTQQTARDYFLRFPELAEGALGDVAKARSALGTLAGELRDHARRKTEQHEEAPLEALPAVLASPPWMGPKPKRTLRVVSLQPPARAETTSVPEALRASAVSQTSFKQFPEMNESEARKYAEQVREGKLAISFWWDRKRVPRDVIRELVTSVGFRNREVSHLPFDVVALFGDEALPAFLTWIAQQTPLVLGNLLSQPKIAAIAMAVDSHQLASSLLALVGQSTASRFAWRWFWAHLESTLAGVLPIAVGRRSAKRTAAEVVLRKLAVRHGPMIRAYATSCGDAARASVEEILAFDERHECPKAPPKMPATWKPEGFTRPRLRDGRALPLEAVERIGHMLAFSKPDAPYAGLADVKAACDPRSLAELAWDAARAWETTGARNADAWMIESIAWLGDDEVIRRATPAIKHGHVIDVLGYAATDAAATELCTIRWRIAHEPGRSWGRAASVDAAFADLAFRREQTVEEIEDALAPTITLAEPRVKLDYGSRTIDVGFDERLDPFVEGPRGRLRELPKAGKKDDPEKVARAEKIWEELQEDVAAIADTRLRSLEHAMVAGRAWSLEAFRKAWTDHLLMRHLARGVVWRASRCFRVAEDGSFADVDDATFDPGDARIQVAHPAAMSDEEREAWRRVFSDYRIVQPIEQLERRVAPRVRGHEIHAKLAEPTAFVDYQGLMRAKGFETGWVDRAQTANRMCANGPERIRLVLEIGDKNVVTGATLSAEREGEKVDLATIDRVDLSEVLHDSSLNVA